jgi:hypothetical protein
LEPRVLWLWKFPKIQNQITYTIKSKNSPTRVEPPSSLGKNKLPSCLSNISLCLRCKKYSIQANQRAHKLQNSLGLGNLSKSRFCLQVLVKSFVLWRAGWTVASLHYSWSWKEHLAVHWKMGCTPCFHIQILC